ncbi:hypothetical protein JH06_2923 [Blastocystis sp. subtype 4]|uniref:hypothetical protein n=1 Tax=Blastocystis sp. subtype 4 TaxID=944170 RepID=UPI000711B7D9|nr:hypothetical protein JH06_2923 [Blastocystis sp. subtype 4]KNB43248.1 hypothetical protein JH06_2923 [Blastocystis sp. subtype 4]|eukprot:XP_014526691.1 hypothetical protein JH06_2923 [Blastocystis sp. subtype 4]
MTIKHIEETRITELGDNKVMKQTVDDAFIDAFMKNDVKPNFLFDYLIYGIRIICGVCGFVSYFKYKDYFGGKEMIAMLCAIYYILAVVDYIISFIFIKKSFLIGSLPTGSKYCDAKEFRAESKCDFGDYDYTLTVSAVVNKETVVYVFVKPVGSYYTKDGVLCRDVVEEDAVAVMDSFRDRLHEAVSKKGN